MKALDRDQLFKMEAAIFDVRDWGEAVRLASAGLSEEAERAAFALLGHTIASLGESLRADWRKAAGVDRHLS